MERSRRKSTNRRRIPGQVGEHARLRLLRSRGLAKLVGAAAGPWSLG